MMLNVLRLTDGDQYKDGADWHAAARIWRNEVVGGAIPTIGGLAVSGVAITERAAELPGGVLAIGATMLLGGVATIGHGIGRLHEMSRRDLVDPIMASAEVPGA